MDSSALRTSEDSLRLGGRYWGLSGSGDTSEDDAGYFTLSTTPSNEKLDSMTSGFATASHTDLATLPTPALSAQSLSQGGSRLGKARLYAEGPAQEGWMKAVYSICIGSGKSRTGEALRDLGWTVGILVVMFIVSAAMALWMVQSLPM